MNKKNKSRAVKLAKLGMAGCCGFSAYCLSVFIEPTEPLIIVPIGIAVSGGMLLKDVLEGDDN